MEPTYDGADCILGPTNEICDVLNNRIMTMLPGEGATYTSTDALQDEDSVAVPVEYLINLRMGGFPNRMIVLKEGSIATCLRDIDNFLRNGTRIRITRLHQRFVEAVVITEGPNFGSHVVVFRVKLYSDEDQFPFRFSRTQLPLRVSYAMTINKAQCQTLRTVGLLLDDENEVFSHGQLYVALSRTSLGAGGVVALKRWLLNVVFDGII